MLEGKLCGIRISFDFSFFFTLAMYFLLDKSGYALLLMASCFVHESGHLAVMVYKRLRIERVLFYGVGIKIECAKQERTCSVLIAGSFTNFLTAFLLALLYEQYLLDIYAFAVANIVTGLFNLLPVGFLDGRNLLVLFLSKYFKPQKSEKILSIIEKTTLILLLLTFIAAVYSGFLNISLIIVFTYNIFVEITRRL